MQDTNTGREYLAEIRNRIADVGRACPSNAQANLRVWRQIGNAVGMELDDTKALYADLKRACILVGKDNPTDTELQTFMTTRMGFDQEKVKTVLFARDLRKKMGNPLVLRALDARVTQAQLGSRSGGVDRRIIRETLQAAFDDVVDESVTDNADLVQEAKATLEIQTQFTGEDAKVIAGRMQERLDTVVVPLTLDQIKAGILAHHTRIGNAPRRSEDASLDFGFPITWSGIDQRLVLQGRSLRLLCSELGLPVAYPGIDLSVDLVTDGALEPEEWECPYE